jgi:hypothetical protein
MIRLQPARCRYFWWCSALLLIACQGSPLPLTGDTARAFFARALHSYWQEEYAAYQAHRPSRNAPPGVTPAVGEQAGQWFLFAFRLERALLPTLPEPVRQAYAFYFHAVEAHDWGNVYLYGVSLAGTPLYIIRTTTDGDDGWVELYDGAGALLGAGRTYIELVAWGEQATIRSQVATGDFPPALADRAARTLWGK